MGIKYYRDTLGGVHGLEDDGSQDFLIGDKVLMTPTEVAEHIYRNSIPNTVTKLQMQLELRSRLMWDDFKARRALDPALDDYWIDSSYIYRLDPVVLSMGLTDAELDDLFLTASKRVNG